MNSEDRLMYSWLYGSLAMMVIPNILYAMKLLGFWPAAIVFGLGFILHSPFLLAGVIWPLVENSLKKEKGGKSKGGLSVPVFLSVLAIVAVFLLKL